VQTAVIDDLQRTSMPLIGSHSIERESASQQLALIACRAQSDRTSLRATAARMRSHSRGINFTVRKAQIRF
jgi:hypothetical protein